MDIQKQIQYWCFGASEDWQVAHDLIQQGRVRHGLFFAHLSLEKLLKALVCLHTQDLAPRIHNLVRLAELTGLSWSDAHIDVLADMNSLNIEGRYPELLLTPPTVQEAQQYLHIAGEVYQWLIQQLFKPSNATCAP